jgi:hypothetical protein
MSTLAMADIHLSANPRDRYRHKIMDKIITLGYQRKVQRFMILGDLTDEKDRHSDWLTNAVADHIRRMAEFADVDILMGNHDYASDPDCPFFRFLRHVPRVSWLGRPTRCAKAGLGTVLFLPHTRSYKRDWRELPLKGNDWVFCHGSFEGAQLGRGREAEGIPLSLFKGERVVAGDLHIPQTILIPSSPDHVSGSVTYVGAPYHIDFGDDYKGRVLLLDGQKLTSIRVEGPQKYLIELDGRKHELDQMDDLAEGDIVKIRVSLSRKAAPLWPAQRDKLRKEWERQGLVVHSIVPVIQEERGPRVKVRARDAKSDEEVLSEFGQHRSVDKGTLKVGRRLL